MNTISVVIPIYKDLNGLDNLLRRIEDSLPSRHEIIIVNDYPKDEIGVLELAHKYNLEKGNNTNFKILNRPGKLGVASAILDGINISTYDKVCTINADLQHPPELIPKMIKELESADIVIASRYVDKGEIEKWSYTRRIISKWAIKLAHLIPRISDVEDPVSGFYALKKDVIKNLIGKNKISPPRNSSVSTGFKLPVEILAKGDYKIVKEIPYKFSDRKSGKTNMGAFSIFTYFKQIISLMNYSGESSRIGKFVIVGFIGSIINITILYLLTEKFFGGSSIKIGGIIPSYVISSMVGIESAILSNFILNEHWTFRDRRDKNDIITVARRGIKFNMCRLTGVGINVVILFFLTSILQIFYILSSMIAIFIVTVWNYTTSVKLVWQKNSSESVEEKKEINKEINKDISIKELIAENDN